MTSRKPRTSSKSGRSGSSKKTGRSPRKGNTSQTVPASFEEVFGKGEGISEEVKRLRALKWAAEGRLTTIQAETTPPPSPLHREEKKAAINRLQRRIRMLAQALEAAEDNH